MLQNTNTLDSCTLPILFQQFGKGPFLLQQDSDPVQKRLSIRIYFEFGVKELRTQSSHLKLAEPRGELEF